MTRRAALVLAGLAVLGWSTTHGETPDAARRTLTVCLQANDPPLSSRGDGTPSGFDVALSRRIAERLGRELRVQWFVSRDDPDANLTKDADALLSDGHCQLLGEYPLLADTLGRPYAATGRLPPFDGAAPDDRRRWIKLGELVATRPYRLDALTVVLSARNADRHVGKLADLDGLKIGVEIATLADAIAMSYADGRLIEHVVHVPDARELFGRLQRGELDAAFADTRELDAWRLRHGADGLAATGYIHSIGFNMGFVGLASDPKLIAEVDTVIADLQSRDAIAPLARDAGLTYAPPRSPAILPSVRPAALAGD